jgi:Ca2+-binding RTX toxin-like protein
MTFHKTLRRLFASPKSARRTQRPAKSRPLAVEYLEDRLVPTATLQIINGVLTYTAGAGIANNLTVSLSGTNYKFVETAETIRVTGITGASGSGTNTVLIPANQVQPAGILIGLGDKADTLSIQSTDNDITVKAGADNDNITVGKLSGIGGAVTVDGEAGNDTLQINDGASGTATTYAITDQLVKSLTSVNAVSYAGTENLTLTAGNQADTFDVLSTNAATKLTVNAGLGDDKFVLGNGGGRLDDLKGALVLNGQSGTDTLTLHDQGSSTAQAFTMTSNSVARSGVPIVTAFTGTEAVSLEAGSGADSVSVQSAVTPVTLDLGGANDSVLIGSNLDAFGATVTVNGQGGADAITVDDSADINGNTYLITDKDVSRNGFKFLSYTGANSLTVTTTNLGDAVTVESTKVGTPVSLNLGGGSDTVRVGKANSLDNIAAKLTVDGQAGTDQVILNDQGAAAGHLDLVTATEVQRSGAAAIDYFGTELLSLSMPNFFNIIGVRGTSDATTVNGGTDTDAFLVGSAAGSLDDIKGNLTLLANGGNDTLKLDDSGDGDPNTYIVGATSVLRTGSGTIGYAGMKSLELDAGNQNDAVTVAGTAAQTPVSLFLGGGNDTVTLGSNITKTMDGITSTVTVDGGAGADAIVLLDTGTSSGRGYVITDADVSRVAFQVLRYFSSESLTLNAGNFADTVTVNSTSATTPVAVNTGGGSDVIKLGGPDTTALKSFPTVDGQGGTDTIDYSAFTRAVRVNLGAGTATGLASLANVENATGGSSDDILIGSAGANVLRGGAGRDILIGLGGVDVLQGQAGDDILIGGSTSLNAAALEAIMLEWSRTDLTGSAQDQFNARVNHIVGGGGKNGATTLDATKVTDDAASDQLTGGGDIDWFFKSGSSATLDNVVDLAAGERLN